MKQLRIRVNLGVNQEQFDHIQKESKKYSGNSAYIRMLVQKHLEGDKK